MNGEFHLECKKGFERQCSEKSADLASLLLNPKKFKERCEV